jgi:hypothetical protein
VTALILFKLIRTKIVTLKALPDRKSPRMYADAMGIIVEAAAPLAFFGICLIVVLGVHFVSPPKKLYENAKLNVVTNVFSVLYYSFCVSTLLKSVLLVWLKIQCSQALSPQMIIFRVTTGQSWKDAAESRKSHGTFSQPIQFTHTRNGREDEESSAGI